MKFIMLGTLCIIIGFISMLFTDGDATYLVLMTIFGVGLMFGSKEFEKEGLWTRALSFFTKCTVCFMTETIGKYERRDYYD